ncbi:LCP family protein [Candidatus Gottesmanbacteria bacterium]|nr:LCP family protein [Candidatus Gottesmanbacteria bacterium]
MRATVRRQIKSRLPILKRVLIGLLLILLVLGVWNVKTRADTYHITGQVIWDLVSSSNQSVKQYGGRTNIVLLGIGGEIHEGGDLTDTIMVVSLGFEPKDIVLISFPRDIWVPSFKDKINASYRTGEAKLRGGGFILSKSVVEEISGLPIHYAVLIDFAGFTRLIDLVGGVDVTIERSFTDPWYPISGKENDLCDGDLTYACRYETVSFTQGIEHMDGARSLKYVRSRHSEGDEGTDFSRGRRQQEILLALKNKILESMSLRNISLLEHIVSEVNRSARSDIPFGEALVLGRMILKSSQNMRRTALTQDIPEKKLKGLLINPPQLEYNNLWVLVPKHQDNTHISGFIQCYIEGKSDCEKFLD